MSYVHVPYYNNISSLNHTWSFWLRRTHKFISFDSFNHFETDGKIAKLVEEKWPFHVDFMKFMKHTHLAVAATFRHHKIKECLKIFNESPHIVIVTSQANESPLFRHFKNKMTKN